MIQDVRIRYSSETGGLRQAKQALESLTQEEKEIIAEFRKMQSQGTQAAKSMQSEFGKLNNTISTVGKAIIASEIVGQVYNMGKAALKSAAEYEQLKVAFTTFLGSAEKADAVLGKLQRFADKTPYDTAQVNQAGKALLAFGVSANQLVPTLTKIGDVASGTGKDFNELAIIYGKARVAGTLYAEDINQLTEAGVPIITEFAKQMGVTEDKVKKLASEGKIGFKQLEAAFTSMTGEGGRFFNLMENQSATALGKWSTFESQTQAIGKAFGEFLLPAAVATLDVLADIGDAIIKIQTPDAIERSNEAAAAAEKLVESFGAMEKTAAAAKVAELTDQFTKLKDEISLLQEQVVVNENNKSLLDSVFGDDSAEATKARLTGLQDEADKVFKAIGLINDSMKETGTVDGPKAVGILEALREKLKQLKEQQEKAQTTGGILSIGKEIDEVETRIKNLTEGLKPQDFFSGIEPIIRNIDADMDEAARLAFDKRVEYAEKAFAHIVREHKVSNDKMVYQEQEAAMSIQEIKEASFSFATDLINAGFEVFSWNAQKQDEQAKKNAEAELKRVGDNEQAKKFINARLAQDEARIRTRQAKAEKDQALLNIGVSTAAAIMKQLSVTPLPAGALPVAFIAAQGLLQAALVAAKPIPKFAKGTEYLQRNGAPAGIDTIPIFANEGERIVQTHINRKLKGIKNADLPKYVDLGRAYLTMQSSSDSQPVVNELKGFRADFKNQPRVGQQLRERELRTFVYTSNQTKEILNHRWSW
jgi:tape measure domain-containing protein